ncbi:S1 RNA-binding domain-containing protein [Streptomyces uncialis]|uniref:S1 RNA-binding domain-containing protein n=1 Tax=Streptomyces uncialis TaxID=1048205 RepID=UPI000D1C924E|nr:S1 RNA-binding domain-containing protein [Streptomyces uncialis]WTE08977.1 S1 RNA-binding domain-containing protein [Streptomyces uncialis]
MTGTGPTAVRQNFLNSVRPGEVRRGTVSGFEGREAIVDLEGATAPPGVVVGRIIRHELSWRRADDPAELVDIGQVVEAEVIGVDRGRECVLLSARACEDQALRAFLVGIRRGDIMTGTVAGVHNFGVFVNLDGEPAENRTGYDGTGFIRGPELSWSHIDHPSDAVEVGQRVTVKVLDADTRQGQVAVSLKAPQEDPLLGFADQVGKVLPGRIVKLVPFGAFVRVAEGIEGLLHLTDLTDEPVGSPEEVVAVGDPVTVKIVYVDPQHRQVGLELARAT